jgi:hypothetical protein
LAAATTACITGLRGHGAAAQIVAIGEAAGQGDEIEAFGQGGVAVPHAMNLAAADVLDCHRHVAVAVRAGEGDDGSAEGHAATLSMR